MHSTGAAHLWNRSESALVSPEKQEAFQKYHPSPTSHRLLSPTNDAGEENGPKNERRPVPSGKASDPPIGVAILDKNTFFSTAAAAWLTRHDPRIQITAVLSHWDDLVIDQLDKTDIAIVDADAANELPLSAKMAVLRTAHIATICLGTATTPERLGAIERVGGRFLLRTEPTRMLLTTIDDLHRNPHSPPARSASSDERTAALLPPTLAPREQRVLALYASGHTVTEVAHIMNLSRHSIVAYIKTIRKKYADAGLPAGTKTALHHRATSARLL